MGRKEERTQTKIQSSSSFLNGFQISKVTVLKKIHNEGKETKNSLPEECTLKNMYSKNTQTHLAVSWCFFCEVTLKKSVCIKDVKMG